MDFLEKEEKLPLEVKNFFRSNEVRWELEKACFLYGIEKDKIKNISGPIGLMYVGDYELKEITNIIKDNLGTSDPITYGLACELNKRLFNKFPDHFKDSQSLLQKWEPLKSAPLISEEEAWQKVLEIEPWILEEEKNKEKELEDQKKIEIERQRILRASLVKIPLAQALKEYPELGEQLITSNHIQLKNFPEPVRPSIKNWLADYTFNLGNKKHNSMERNTYIFHGTNARGLNSYDRQKLASILVSFDENTNIFVNKNTRQVVFEKESQPVNSLTRNSITPKIEPQPSSQGYSAPQPPQSLPTQKKADSDLKFSFPQKMPYETAQSKSADSYPSYAIKPAPVAKKLNPIVRIPKEIKEDKKDERALGKNVVNLRE